MQDFKDDDLEFWIKHNYNVLFIGVHGTGKTARVLEAFEKQNLKYRYFSAATMDPWVDFIGVPKERLDANGEPYLDLVRPRHFANDEVEAIFLDEFNRSSKKVRNAVMELIQFKSINGKKFNNLKVVWAAINPDDEEKTYDVEALDPAQKDRFHFQVEVSPRPNLFYFENLYGKENAKAAIEWWDSLEAKQKALVSPRRLDYALDVFMKGGNIRYVLSQHGLSVSSLISTLRKGSVVDRLEDFIKNNQSKEAREFLRNENNYNSAIAHILKNQDWMKYFLPLMTEEKVITLMNNNTTVEEMVLGDFETHQKTIEQLALSDSSELSTKAQRIFMTKNPEIQTRNQPSGALYVTDTVLDIKHNPEKNLNNFIADYAAFMLKHPNVATDLASKKAAYQFLLDTVPFDLVEDETQVKGNDVALKTVDLVGQIVDGARKDTLKAMPDLGKIMNHVLFYMGIFQQQPDPSDTVQHDPNMFFIKDPASLQKTLDKLTPFGVVKFGVKA